MVAANATRQTNIVVSNVTMTKATSKVRARFKCFRLVDQRDVSGDTDSAAARRCDPRKPAEREENDLEAIRELVMRRCDMFSWTSFDCVFNQDCLHRGFEQSDPCGYQTAPLREDADREKLWNRTK